MGPSSASSYSIEDSKTAYAQRADSRSAAEVVTQSGLAEFAEFAEYLGFKKIDNAKSPTSIVRSSGDTFNFGHLQDPYTNPSKLAKCTTQWQQMQDAFINKEGTLTHLALQILSASSYATEEQLDFIARNNCFELQLLVAQNAKTNDQTLDFLLQAYPLDTNNDNRHKLLIAIANNTNLSQNMQNSLASSGNVQAMEILAQNKHCSAQTLHTLMALNIDALNLIIAEHHNTFPDDLTKLALDGQKQIQRAALGNPNCPGQTMLEFATKTELDTDISDALFGNINASRKVCHKLSNDSQYDDDLSASTLRGMVPYHPTYKKDQFSEILIAASHKNTAPYTLNRIIDLSEQIVAHHGTEKLLEMFECLLENPTISFEALSDLHSKTALLESQTEGVMIYLRPTIAQTFKLQVLISMAQHPGATPKFLDMYARSPDKEVRAAVAASAKTPSFWLGKLSNDDEYCVRFACANNDNATAVMLAILAGDETVNIRFLVAQRKNTDLDTLNSLVDWAMSDKLTPQHRAHLLATVAAHNTADAVLLEKIFHHAHSLEQAEVKVETEKCSNSGLIFASLLANPSTPLPYVANILNRHPAFASEISAQHQVKQFLSSIPTILDTKIIGSPIQSPVPVATQGRVSFFPEPGPVITS